jgi:hypothetical protein
MHDWNLILGWLSFPDLVLLSMLNYINIFKMQSSFEFDRLTSSNLDIGETH